MAQDARYRDNFLVVAHPHDNIVENFEFQEEIVDEEPIEFLRYQENTGLWKDVPTNHRTSTLTIMPSVDIDCDSDNNDNIERSDWEEEIENDADYLGQFVWFNCDDDNENGVADYLENADYGYPDGGNWVPFTDDDLVPVVLDRGFEDLSDMNGFVFELKLTTDTDFGLSYWLDPEKTPIVGSAYDPDETITFNEGGNDKTIYRWLVSGETANYPPTIYVEGINPDCLTDTMMWRLLKPLSTTPETYEEVSIDTVKMHDPTSLVGVVLDYYAIEGTDDRIGFTFVRMAADKSESLDVYFKINYAATNESGIVEKDFERTGLFPHLVWYGGDVSDRGGGVYSIRMPAGETFVTTELKAISDPGVTEHPIEKTTMQIEPRPDYAIVPKPVQIPGDPQVRKATKDGPLYILRQITYFADDNLTPSLTDADPSGVDMNDIRQGQIGDCYFLVALMILADNEKAFLQSRFDNIDMPDRAQVNLFLDTGGPYSFSTDGADILCLGNTMAYLSEDFDDQDRVEIWPQLLERAWAHLRGVPGAVNYGKIESGWVKEAWKALTNQNGRVEQVGGLSSEGIFNLIDQSLRAGKYVALDTLATIPPALLNSPPYSGNLAGGHAYYVKNAFTETAGVKWVTVYNPWWLVPSKVMHIRLDHLKAITSVIEVLDAP